MLAVFALNTEDPDFWPELLGLSVIVLAIMAILCLVVRNASVFARAIEEVFRILRERRRRRRAAKAEEAAIELGVINASGAVRDV